VKGGTSNGWREVKLADVATSKGEYGSGASAVDYDPKKPRYVRITDIDDEGHIKDHDPKSPSEIEPKYFLGPDDFLFARSGSIGRTYVHTAVDGRYQYAGYLIRFKLKTSLIIPKYLYYLTRSPMYWHWIQGQQKSVTISNINAKQYADFSFILPPLSVQRKIVAFLDKLEASRALRKRSDELTHRFMSAVFYHMFGGLYNNKDGFEIRILDDLKKDGTLITYGIVQAGPNVYDGVPYIKTGDIQDGVITEDGLAKTDRRIASKFKRSEVHSGDLVYSIRATVGTVALLPKSLDGANLTQGTAKICPGPSVNKYYLLWYLRSNGCQTWIRNRLKGATFKEITLATLRQTPILLPPLHLQNEFAKLVEKVESLGLYQKQSSSELENLFENLLQNVSKGESSC
jgi:type I restriction enzyme S subunit